MENKYYTYKTDMLIKFLISMSMILTLFMIALFGEIGFITTLCLPAIAYYGHKRKVKVKI